MSLVNCLRSLRRIDAFEVISFPHVPPQLVGLIKDGQIVAYIGSRVLEIEERDEFGIIELLPSDRTLDESAVLREIFKGGELRAVEPLSLPNRKSLSGLNLRINDDVVTITSGSMPYSIFFKSAESARGRPEVPLQEYVSFRGAT